MMIPLKKNVYLLALLLIGSTLIISCDRNDKSAPEQEIKQLSTLIKALKNEGAELEKTIKELEVKVVKINYRLNSLDQTYDALYFSKKISFWESYQWLSWQLNVVLLLLLVLWLLYRVKLRTDD